MFVVNVVAFQAAWFSSVLGGAHQMPWIGPMAVLIALAIHLRAARKPFEEIMLAMFCAFLGAGFDSILVAMDWVSYTSGLFSDVLAPYWIITMWILFATTLNVSMRWLRGSPVLASVFGFLGGPTTYIAGEKLGGIIFIDKPAALLALGVGWAIMMPMLTRVSESFDGMPGRSRVWRRAEN